MPAWLVIVIALGAIAIASASSGDSEVDGDIARLGKTELESAKLREEVQKLRDEQDAVWYGKPITWTALTVLVAGGGLIFTQINQGREFSRQSQLDREQRDATEEQRRKEHEQATEDRQEEAERRREERFSGLARALSAPNRAERVSALVGIESFLEEKSDEYRDRLFTLLRGVLTVPWSEKSDRAIARAFVKVLRTQLAANPEFSRQLDLEDVQLSDVDLTGLQLAAIDGIGINLTNACLDDVSFDHAVLTGATLKKAKGNQATSFRRADFNGERTNVSEAELRNSIFVDATFRDATMTSAKLHGADCTRAVFVNAKVQSTHFEDADLTEASFNKANVKDAYFQGATFSNRTLESLVEADNWKGAHWDAETLEELKRLDADRSEGEKSEPT